MENRGNITSYNQWIGTDAYDQAGEKIGEITDIFYDDRTGRPEWLAVDTGMFGTKHTLVPIHGSMIRQDDDGDDSLLVAFTKAQVKDAPRVDSEGQLPPKEEQKLWEHYGYDYQADPKLKTAGYGPAYQRNRADKDYAVRRYDTATDQWRDAGEAEEVTIHNQEAQVVDQPETVRLRKYERTEMVPVTKEEVRVERSSDQAKTKVRQ
jgi:hypothetical protein